MKIKNALIFSSAILVATSSGCLSLSTPSKRLSDGCEFLASDMGSARNIVIAAFANDQWLLKSTKGDKMCFEKGFRKIKQGQGAHEPSYEIIFQVEVSLFELPKKSGLFLAKSCGIPHRVDGSGGLVVINHETETAFSAIESIAKEKQPIPNPHTI